MFEDLIIHKIFSGRPRDLEDVRSILFKNAALDIRYLMEWLTEFEKSPEKKGWSRHLRRF